MQTGENSAIDARILYS